MSSLSLFSFFTLFLNSLSLKLPKSNFYTVPLGFDSESVTYDSENKWWLIADDTLTAPYIRAWAPTGATDPTGGTFGPVYSPVNNESIALQYPAGMYRDNDNDVLYIANLGNGYIVAIDTTNNDTLYSLSTGGNPNGMCYNPLNNMLYVTDTAAFADGTQQIWELYMNLTVSRSFLTPTSKVYPNGCIIKDDTLYVVQFYNYENETLIDNLGVIYWTDISSASPTRGRAGAAHGLQCVDGIVMDADGNLWIDYWGGDCSGEEYTGSLWYLAAEDITDPTAKWTKVTGNIVRSPANMAFDSNLGWILIPSFYGQELYIVNPELSGAISLYTSQFVYVVLFTSLVALFF